MVNQHSKKARSPKRMSHHLLQLYKRILPFKISRRLDIIARRLLIYTITFYQRRLSPYKKFSCAYRVLYNSHSCSQSVKEILQNYPLPDALPRIQKQFRQCGQAVKIIRDRRIHSPRCRHLATPENILFPTLNEGIFPTRRGDPGYGRSLDEDEERSRRDRRRRNDNAVTQPYDSWCDCSVCYCADFDVQADGNGECCDGPGNCSDSCTGCDGCDFCACDCA